MHSLDLKRGIDIARMESHVTLGELAKRSGINRSQLFRYRYGRIKPSLDSMERIAGACGVPLSRLIYWAEGGK